MIIESEIFKKISLLYIHIIFLLRDNNWISIGDDAGIFLITSQSIMLVESVRARVGVVPDTRNTGMNLGASDA